MRKGPSRAGESRFKRLTADLFYRLIGLVGEAAIPRDVGDFRLVDRKALDCFLAMPERDRFVRGMFAWIGFRQAVVTFDRPRRAAGETKYPLRKMIHLAASGLVSFSDAPLRLALWAGAGVSALALVYGLVVIAQWATGDPNLDARLEFDHRRHRLSRRREHADDGRDRDLCRAHPRRGERPPALHRRTGGRI